MNGIFFPMLIQGLKGMSRRMYDGGEMYDFTDSVMVWNKVMTMSAFTLAVVQLVFIFNFFWSIKRGEKVGANPWSATTLEWTDAPSPPVAHGNFPKPPQVFRAAYEYSVPGQAGDYKPQSQEA
jgi:cytochrome c oxidase subunit 1